MNPIIPTFSMAASVLLTLCTTSIAAPSDLDVSFGTGGKVVSAQPAGFSSIRSVRVQTDGKIVAGGGYSKNARPEFIVLRYNEDGTPDSSFGTAGLVETVFPGNVNSYGNALGLQSDGKIVLGGTINGFPTGDFGLARYNSDGTLDSSFGVGGLVRTSVSSSGTENATELAIQSDGSILLAGYANLNGSNDFAVVRYLPNGTLDSTFGTGGIVTTNVTGNDLGNCLKVLPDGKIVVGGGADGKLAVVRYNSNGSLDLTFGSAGKVVTTFSSATSNAMAVLAGGKLLFGGGGSFSFTAVRLNADGSDDNSFGSGGSTSTPIGTRGGVGYGLAIQSDGRVLIAGVVTAGSEPTLADMGVARFLQNGALDTTFGNNGAVATNISGNDWANDVFVQPNGRILVAGYSRSASGSQDNATLVRYVGGPVSTPSVVLLGANPLTIEAGTTYSEPGATASDPEDGPLTPSVTVNTVNPNVPGTYAVTWTATDSGGLTSSASRVVNVRDTTAPTVVAPEGGYSPSSIYYRSAMPDYRFQAVASDFVGVTERSQSPPPGTPVALGTVRVTVSARDAAGNIGSHSFDITGELEPVVVSRLATRGQTVDLARPHPAVPAGSVWTYFSSPALDEHGAVTFLAKWRKPGNPLAVDGIFIWTSEGTTLLAHKRGQVDGIAGATWKEFGAPSALQNGTLTFLAKIEGFGVYSGNDSVVALAREGSVVILAREGDVAPQTGGARYKSFSSSQPVGTGPHSEVVVTARLENGSGLTPVTGRTDDVVMLFKESDDGRIDAFAYIREGSSYPHLLSPDESAKGITILTQTAGSAGQARAEKYGLCKTSSGRSVIFRATPNGEAEMVLSTGARVGGETYPLAEWARLGIPSGESYLVQRAQLKLNGGIVRGTETGVFGLDSGDFAWKPLAMTGDTAPGMGTNAVFSTCRDPLGGGDSTGGVAFQGTARGPSVPATDNDAIWWQPPGETMTRGRWMLIAREGGLPPGAAPGAQWHSFRSLALPTGRGPLFTARLREGLGGVSSSDDAGLYGIGSDGVLRELLRENSALGGKTVRSFNVLNGARGAIGQTREFNSNGDVVLTVEFTDATGGIAIISIP